MTQHPWAFTAPVVIWLASCLFTQCVQIAAQIKQRIDYKILTLTYKVLNTTQLSLDRPPLVDALI